MSIIFPRRTESRYAVVIVVFFALLYLVTFTGLESSTCTHLRIREDFSRTDILGLTTLEVSFGKHLATVPSGGMVSQSRKVVTALLSLAALKKNIIGDFVETGTNAGGSFAVMVKALMVADNSAPQRKIWGADSFSGLPEAVAGDFLDSDINDADNASNYGDFKLASRKTGKKGRMKTTENELMKTLRKTGTYDLTRIKLLKGWFNETLPSAGIEKISFLRLDGDMYSSTLDGLNYLYHKVSPGGFIYIDDYGSFEGCRRATDEFRHKHGITTRMHKVEEERNPRTFEAVWWQK